MLLQNLSLSSRPAKLEDTRYFEHKQVHIWTWVLVKSRWSTAFLTQTFFPWIIYTRMFPTQNFSPITEYTQFTQQQTKWVCHSWLLAQTSITLQRVDKSKHKWIKHSIWWERGSEGGSLWKSWGNEGEFHKQGWGYMEIL